MVIFRRICCGTPAHILWPELSHALDIRQELHRSAVESAVARKKKSWKHPATFSLHLKPS